MEHVQQYEIDGILCQLLMKEQLVVIMKIQQVEITHIQVMVTD
jgi:hypothetical protein